MSMRLISKIGLSLILSSGFASVGFAADKVASVKVSIEDKAILPKAAGIRTMFFVLFDSASKAPRPLGAVKVELKEDAKGTFYTADINVSDVQTMGTAFVMPKTLKIKARLDKDGSAGADKSGDLVGIVEGINPGDKAEIKIQTAI